ITIKSLTHGTRVLHTQVREGFYSIEREKKTGYKAVILITMGRICSRMIISTPMTISKLDLMKPSSKIASRMCSSHFLSLGLCFCSENPILSLVARNWVKTKISQLTRAGHTAVWLTQLPV
ncbi:unnamed protein product, partial [Linum tenue]